MSKFPSSTFLAAATFAGILLEFHYAVDPARGMDLHQLRPAVEFRHDREAFFPVHALPLPPVPESLAIPDPAAPGWTPAIAANLTLETADLFDQSGALDHFYAALDALAQGKRTRPVRIVHYGDSPTTADLITGDARELLQDRFGDAGPGFVLIAKPWAWYGHHGVEVDGTGWTIATAVGSMREGEYGLGGASFTGQPGASSTIRLTARDLASIEIDYLERPGAGSIEVLADGASVGTVSTAGDEHRSGAQTLALPAGTKIVSLRVAGAAVEVFGVAFATGKSGVTYDSIGLNGASTTVMSRAFQPANWSEALQHRDPDLVVINYGTNESGYLKFIDDQYEGELRRAIQRVRSALPEASILVMSPMDRGQREGGDAITTMPGIPRLVEIQQRVAADTGCGFFNTFAAMGGQGTMERWYDGHPRLVAADFIHPTPQGARIVAQALTGQLLIGYERYRQRHAPQARPTATRVAGASNLTGPGNPGKQKGVP
jgi:lysophospholipase L1-like esterase